MKENNKIFNKIINPKIIAIIISMILIVSYFSISGSTMIAKVNGNLIGNTPISKDGETYVPLNEIAQKMGEKVTALNNQKKVVIKKKDGTVVSVTANQAQAILNGQIVPIKTKTVKKSVVPDNVKTLYKNGQVYVPIEFISSIKGMNYSVKTYEESGKIIINIGILQIDDKNTNPQNSIKGKTYSDGWVAPVIKSKWTTSDYKTNIKIFEKELGFTNGGSSFDIPHKKDAIFIADSQFFSGYESTIAFAGWQNEAVFESYRIPVIAKELFKFYFEKDANRVIKYFDSGKVPDKFNANGRNITMSFSETDGYLYMKIGYKK